VFVAFLGTKLGDPSRVEALKSSNEEVEECGLKGIEYRE
jgi:hypothetical protein